MLTLILHGGRCLSTAGDPQGRYIGDFGGNRIILPIDRYIVIKKKALASHSACLLVLSRLFPPSFPSVVSVIVP